MRRHIAIVALLFCLSTGGFGCDVFSTPHKVGLSFSVLVHKKDGAVVGLKLRIVRFKIADYMRLSPEEAGKADSERFVEVIGRAVTDNSGMAHFELRAPGGLRLEPEHPANTIFDGMDLDVNAANKATTLDFEWPTAALLRTTHLRGRIMQGLMSSQSPPFQKAVVTLHRLVTYETIASATTGEDGSFRFDDVPPGDYFLHLRADGITAENEKTSYLPHGDIAISVNPEAPSDSLAIAMQFSSCGLSYDLESNKDRYKPVACFKGGKPAPCDY